MTTESYTSAGFSTFRPQPVPRSQVNAIKVKQYDGATTLVDEGQLSERVARLGQGLEHVNPALVASKTLSGLYHGVAAHELDACLMQTAAMMISEEPEYSKLAARMLAQSIREELAEQGLTSFAASIAHGFKAGLIAANTAEFVAANADEFEGILNFDDDQLFEFFGLRTVYDRYLLKDPSSRQVIECPQYFFLRVACGLAQSVAEAREFYALISSFQYMPATPTLFNSGTAHPQMSSCYLLDSPQDNLEAIYGKYTDVALLSKFAGGIGLSFSRIRSRGSLIRGTNGKSNGIVPFLKTLDSSVAAVNQGGKRKGAACVYLETWHADISEFLALRENTGDEALRTHNLNLANWVPDLFMKRVEEDAIWSLFDPKDVPHFPDLFGREFEVAYIAAEASGLYKKQIKARELYAAMMKTLAQTGNGWMTFKDASNLKANQTLRQGNVIHLSNLCTEILEVTSDAETAVCNLGSINLSRYVTAGAFDFERLGRNVQMAVKYLDRVIDINFYPIPTAHAANKRWRPVGLGAMGLQNVFFQLKLPFDSDAARQLSARIQEEIYFHALTASAELAAQVGPHESFQDTRAAQGQLQFDLWGVTPSQPERWEALRAKIKESGLRNSLLLAIAPTATIAAITGSYECIEPQVSNLFKRETLSGEFLQVNPYLVNDLRRLGLWNQNMRNRIKVGEGSIEHIDEIPEALRLLYRTVWEIPQRALIDMAAERGAFIDQSQSLNLFLENPTLGKLSSMYQYAWKKGLKTCYYLRSRGATRINKTTMTPLSDEKAMACSLENPESCESCQ